MDTKLIEIGPRMFLRVDANHPSPEAFPVAKKKAKSKRVERQPCIRLGEPTGETQECSTCAGRVQIKLRSCTLHGKCTEATLLPQVACCQICNDRTESVGYEPLRVGPDEVVRLTNDEIGRHKYFNCSILEFGGKTLLAVRQGWSGANIAICELDPETLRPRRTTEIFPTHDLCHAGREDPRLFVHRDHLHVYFAGVQKERGKLIVHPMVSRLEWPDLHVEDTWLLEYGQRQPWEKNWGMISHDSELYAVHTIAPHLVLHLVDGKEGFPFARHEWQPKWAGGMLRGGAAPILVGDEYYSFFHGALDQKGNPKRVYTIGLYTFSAKPPFKPLRYTPEPILWPNNDDRPEGLGISVAFPCGAILRGDRWLVSYGYHDRWCEIASFDARDIERAMVKC